MPSHEELQNGGGKALGIALIVEDNIMIALEVETHLQDLGAGTCFIASSVESALAILDLRDIAFGVIDVDLGGETSEKVAMALMARGVPFLFATGYGDALPMMANFPSVPVLVKPFPPDTLARALAEIGVL